MPLPDDKTFMNVVLDKSVKHKLQVLANADNLKLSPYVAKRLQELVEQFEYEILEIYGADGFPQTYFDIFGTEYQPHIPYDIVHEFSEEEARRNLIQAIHVSSKMKIGQTAVQAIGRATRIKREPSDE